MKKISVVFLGVLIAIMARPAYGVPTGCFIDDLSSDCYQNYFNQSDCDQYNMIPYNFGDYIYSMCSYVNSVESFNSTCSSTLEVCKTTLGNVAAQRDNVSAIYGNTEQNRQEWIAYAGKRDKLIAKLYKACGGKCRRIK